MIHSKSLALSTRSVLGGVVALAVASSLGCAAIGPGCGAGIGCGVPATGCCGCSVEPGCGCAAPCGPRGYTHAGEKFVGDCGCGPKRPLINVCEGPGCGAPCDPGCGCEPACGIGGCGDAVCGYRPCPVAGCIGFGLQSIGEEIRRVFGPLGLCCGGCGGCGGCSSEVYWSEWHNDPPVCCDPCDDCGGWVGPSPQTVPPAEFEPRRVTRLPGSSRVERLR